MHRIASMSSMNAFVGNASRAVIDERQPTIGTRVAMVRAFVLLLSVLTSACAGDRYHLDNVAYDSKSAWLTAMQKDNSAMVAAIRQRSRPVAEAVRIFVPTSENLEEWL